MTLAPQVSAPPLTWMCIAHDYSQGHGRLNLDTASYNMLGVDNDGEEEARGPWIGAVIELLKERHSGWEFKLI